MQLPRIFVADAIGARTGGPEACHQLVSTVNELGGEAVIFPLRGYEEAAPEPEYARYECDIVRRVPDRPRGHVVIPEVWPTAAARFRGHLMTMWWLSVDNSPLRVTSRWVNRHQPEVQAGGPREPALPQSIGIRLRTRVRDVARQTKLSAAEAAVKRSRVSHIAQSSYAAAFCRDAFNRCSPIVSDYLRPIDWSDNWAGGDGTVWFNGAKGRGLVTDLARRAPHIRFCPIEGMSFNEVIENLSRGSAYLEVGHLPGRDRLPREAARLGVPVVMLQRGAGQFADDFPYLDQTRVPVGHVWQNRLLRTLEGVLADPVEAAQDQKAFRAWVGCDRDRFLSEVSTWLTQIEELHAGA